MRTGVGVRTTHPVGVVIVTAWAFYRGVPIRPVKGEGWQLFLLSVLFTVQIGLLNSGTAMTSPAFGVVILVRERLAPGC